MNITNGEKVAGGGSMWPFCGKALLCRQAMRSEWEEWEFGYPDRLGKCYTLSLGKIYDMPIRTGA